MFWFGSPIKCSVQPVTCCINRIILYYTSFKSYASSTNNTRMSLYRPRFANARFLTYSAFVCINSSAFDDNTLTDVPYTSPTLVSTFSIRYLQNESIVFICPFYSQNTLAS